MKKNIHQTYKFRLEPTSDQLERFLEFAGARRWVWNVMLEERQVCYEHTGETPSKTEQMKRLTAIKNNVDELGWLNNIHSQVLQQAIHDLDDAFDHFFEDGFGYPNFKSRKNPHQTFRFPQGVNVTNGEVHLPKIGEVSMKQTRRVVGDIGEATVKRENGSWFVCLHATYDVDVNFEEPTEDNTVGVDLGLDDFAVLSNGQRINHPQNYREYENKLRKEQRKLSRKQEGSRRYQKQKAIVEQWHRKVRNVRQDFLHKLSTRLVDENQAIVVEDLSVSGLARSNLAKSIHDSGWSEFVRMLKYKGRRRGCRVIVIDRYFPSSKMCRHCGHVNDIQLSDRTVECESCSATLDRDLNAAKNIKQKGLRSWSSAGQAETQNARGESTAIPLESAA